MRTLISLCCVLFSNKGDALGGVQQDCVESCKEGSHQEKLGDQCYFWSTVTKSWQNSESHCQDENGHLAAVTSLEIHNFLMKKVNKDDKTTWFWIGGSDKGQEGNWEWTDGSVWNFTIWADQPFNQPTGKGYHQDCLQIYHNGWAQNGWNDNRCSSHFLFICSWRVCPGLEFFKERKICPLLFERNILSPHHSSIKHNRDRSWYHWHHRCERYIYIEHTNNVDLLGIAGNNMILQYPSWLLFSCLSGFSSSLCSSQWSSALPGSDPRRTRRRRRRRRRTWRWKKIQSTRHMNSEKATRDSTA